MELNLFPPPILIFVRPQAAGNIGAMARAMSNFGADQLRLVGEGVVYAHREDDPFSKMDWAMAKRGEHILNSVKWFRSLKDALFDTGFALGTSGRNTEFERGYGRPFCNPSAACRQVAEWKEQAPENFKWALIIGPEDDGLNEGEASLCQKLIQVPTTGPNPSLNAAMAVDFVGWVRAAGDIGAFWGARADRPAFIRNFATSTPFPPNDGRVSARW